MPRVLLFLILGCIANTAFATKATTAVSRKPPGIYRHELAEMLTPATQVLAGRAAFPEDKSDGTVLLDEMIYCRGSDQLLYRVHHLIQFVREPSAVQKVANVVFGFDRERESVFLVDAATLQPDGRSQPVESSGAFIQTPQRAADEASYTSQAELNVVFPNVAVGTATEVIVVVRENTPVMPGTFACIRPFGEYWPVFRLRFIVDLPEAEWRRVQTSADAGVPEPATSRTSHGRIRKVWTANTVPRFPMEEDAPTLAFCAPTLWLTTVPDWNAVAHWFETLIDNRSDLDPALAQTVDSWTQGVSEPRKIVEILHEKVANDVRYTGLEFGMAGFQPQPCRDVWKNRYGDCKDKANLLRAMLEHKGIPAQIALVQADGLGRIRMDSPSWMQFNHAILVVDGVGTAPFVCDPTAKFLPAGHLAMGDCNRDAMIVRNDHAAWVHLPDLLDSAIRVHCDMTLAPSGELNGWITLGGEGSDAAAYAARFGELDHDGRVRVLQHYMGEFFPGTEIVDHEMAPPQGSLQTFQIRAYCLRPARSANGLSLRFPFPTDWLPKTETVGERRFPFAAARREESFDLTLNLPPGWAAQFLPAPFSAPSANASFSAKWESTDGVLRAHLDWRPEHAEIAAKDYAAFQQSARALTAWLDQPVVLTPSGGKSPAPTTAAGKPEGELADFPMLSNGQAQLDLVDRRYPMGTANAERRAALQKTMQWFPNEAPAMFTAQIKLAILDHSETAPAKLAEAVAGLRQRYAGQVSPELDGWAELVETEARWRASKDPAALKTLERLANDPSQTPLQRARMGLMVSIYLMTVDPKAAPLFLQPFTEIESEMQGKLVNLFFALLLQNGDTDRLRTWLREFTVKHASSADTMLAEALKAATAGWSMLAPTVRAQAFQVLEETLPAGLSVTAGSMAKLRAAETQALVRDKLATTLRQQFEKYPAAWYSARKSDASRRSDVLYQEMTNNEVTDWQLRLVDACELLSRGGLNEAGGNTALWYALWWLDRNHGDDSLLELLARTTLELHEGANNDALLECWQIAGAYFNRVHRSDDARIAFKQIAQYSTASAEVRARAHGELGRLDVLQGRPDDALADFREIESPAPSYDKKCDDLYLDLLVHLERGDYDRAIEILKLLGQQPAHLRESAGNAGYIRNFLQAAEHPDALGRFWKRAPNWRLLWEKIDPEAGREKAGLAQPLESAGLAEALKQATAAAAAGNKVEFVRNARPWERMAEWLPEAVPVFVEIMEIAPRISGPLAEACRECAETMLNDRTDLVVFLGARVDYCEGICLLVAGHKAEAAAKFRTAYETVGIQNSFGEFFLWKWAFNSAGGTDEEAAVNELRLILDGGRPLVQRLKLVQALAYLLNRAGNHVEEIRTRLTAETSRPDFDASSEFGQRLSAGLRSLPAPTGGFDAIVESWRKRPDLAWLEEQPFATKIDAQYATLTDLPKDNDSSVAPAQRLALDLRFALDHGRPMDIRSRAFASFVQRMAWRTGDARRCADTAIEAAGQTDLPPALRTAILQRIVAYLLSARQAAMVDRVLASPETQGCDAAWRQRIQACCQGLRAIDHASPDWAKEAWNVVTGPLPTINEVLVLQHVLFELVLAARTDEAETMFKQIETLQPDPSFAVMMPAIRLKLARDLQALKGQAPFFAALNQKLRALPEAGLPIPESVQMCMAPGSGWRFSDQDAVMLALWWLHYRSAAWAPAAISTAVLRPLARSRDFAIRYPQFGIEIAEIALATPGSDANRKQWFTGAVALCDYDCPEVRRTLVSRLQTYFDSAQSTREPETRRAAAVVLARIALRTSPEPHPPALFEWLDRAGVDDTTKQELRLVFYHTRGKEAECVELLDQMPVDSMSKAAVFPIVRPLLLRENRHAELETLDTVVKARIGDNLAATWYDPSDASTAYEALELAEVLGPQAGLSERWLESVKAGTDSPKTIARLALLYSRCGNDWATRRAAADRLIQLQSNKFDIYYDRGLAAHHLGDDKAAVADLRVFLTYEHNNHRYPDALTLFHQLAAGAEVPSEP